MYPAAVAQSKFVCGAVTSKSSAVGIANTPDAWFAGIVNDNGRINWSGFELTKNTLRSLVVITSRVIVMATEFPSSTWFVERVSDKCGVSESTIRMSAEFPLKPLASGATVAILEPVTKPSGGAEIVNSARLLPDSIVIAVGRERRLGCELLSVTDKGWVKSPFRVMIPERAGPPSLIC